MSSIMPHLLVLPVFSRLLTLIRWLKICALPNNRKYINSSRKTRYEWFMEAVNDVRDTAKEFQNKYCSALGASSMLKSSTYYSYTITSLSTNNAVTLAGRSNALEGNYTVKVLQLASNATAKSSGTVSRTAPKFHQTTQLPSVLFRLKMTLYLMRAGR